MDGVYVSLPRFESDEAIRAWRAWKVNVAIIGVPADDMSYRLTSLFKGDTWQPRNRLAALCQDGTINWTLTKDKRVELVLVNRHAAPNEACKCGIYGVRTKELLERYLASTPYDLQKLPFAFSPKLDAHEVRSQSALTVCLAVGVVSLWGNVIEGEDGWRAQYAYPYDISVYTDNMRVAAFLREQYQVDVRSKKWTLR